MVEIKAAPVKRKTQGSTRSKAGARQERAGGLQTLFNVLHALQDCRKAPVPPPSASPIVPWLIAETSR